MHKPERIHGCKIKAVSKMRYSKYEIDDIFTIKNAYNNYGFEVFELNEDDIPCKKNFKILLDETFLKKFKEEKIAVNCKDKKESKSFLNYLHSFGVKWHSGDSLLDSDLFASDTCFYLNFEEEDDGVTIGDVDFSIEEDYTVINFRDCIIESKSDKGLKKVMKYKVVRPFTLKDILDKSPCMSEFSKLVGELSDSDMDVNFKFDTKHLDIYSTLKNNINWLIDKGFVEEEKEIFKPFNITFRIDSEERLKSLWKSLNVGDFGYWKQVDNEMYRLKN